MWMGCAIGLTGFSPGNQVKINTGVRECRPVELGCGICGC